MKAIVVEIASGSVFTDKERRVTLRFPDADIMFNQLRFKESVLGLRDVRLDQTVDVELTMLPGTEGAALPKIIYEQLKMKKREDDKW